MRKDVVVVWMMALVGCTSQEKAIRDLASGDPARQLAAAERLSQKPQGKALLALREGLHAEDEGVRLACARALATTSDPTARIEAAKFLTTAILEATTLSQAQSRMKILSQFGGTAFPEFVTIATVALDPRLRSQVAKALKETLPPASPEERTHGVNILLNALQETHPPLFGAAYETLEWLADPLAEEWVTQGLTHPNSTVRRAVATALSVSRSSIAVHGLMGALKDTDPAVRRDAVRSLGKIASPTAKEALKKVAAQDLVIEVRQAARQALASIPEER